MEYVQKKDIPYFTDFEVLVAGFGHKLVALHMVCRKSVWCIKVVVYNAAGIGIDDCAKVHRALLARAEAILNSQDIEMEVGSPGLNRVIKHTVEFDAFAGEKIKVLQVNCSEWIEGVLLFADSTHIGLKIAEKEHAIAYADVKKAKLNKI